MSVSPTVMVACDDLILLDEVIRHLEEIPQWKLVMSARSADELLNQVTKPDCVLASDGLAVELADHPQAGRLTGGLVVFGRQETTPALRAALSLGARGFVQWPEEREQIRGLVERGTAIQAPSALPAGALHAVWAPKGGGGSTVIAAHLAGSLATLGRDAIIVDLDLDHADQTSILGAEPEHKTVRDLIRVSEELSRQTVASVLWRHPLGFHAVLAPGRIGDTASADASRINKVLGTIREAAEHVVVDLPSGLNPVSTASLLDASSVEVVLTPDLLGLRRTRDLLKNLDSLGLQRDRINVVLNQAGGPDITEKEVEAVLGVAKVVRLRADLRIYRAANRGELSPLACKLLTPLARRLVAEHSGIVRPAPATQPEPSTEAVVNAASVPVASIEGRQQPTIREVQPVGGRPAGGMPPARANEPVAPRLTPAAAPNPSNPLQARRVWRSGAGTR